MRLTLPINYKDFVVPSVGSVARQLNLRMGRFNRSGG